MDYKVLVFTSFLIAFLIALALTPAAIALAPRIGAVDTPKDERRMHTKPMPRFGGLGIFVGVTVSVVVTTVFLIPNLEGIFYDGQSPKLFGVAVGGALIWLVGVADDLRGLPAKLKFVLQIVCACVVCAFGVRMTFLTNPIDGGWSYLGDVASFVFTVVWIVGITNTINLIDGLDGLAGGIAAIASAGIAFTAGISGMYTVCIVMAAVTGGALGFLPFNFHPARIFMGDGGALFLGFMLAAVSMIGPVKSATVIAVIVPVLVLGLPIFDTCFAILRRIAGGRPIMEADKGHLHHRLMAAGMGQKRSVLTLYGIGGVMSVAAVLFSRRLLPEAGALIVIAAVFIYVLLSDASGDYAKPRGVNAARREKRERAQRSAERTDE